jgi:hypothetical protein
MSIKQFEIKTIIRKWDESPDEFCDYELNDIVKLGTEWAAYWYEIGCYCGDGYIIMRKDRKWYIHNCSHCSCYGPTEDIALREGFDTIEQMRKDGSEQFNKEIEYLFKIAEENKEEWN